MTEQQKQDHSRNNPQEEGHQEKTPYNRDRKNEKQEEYPLINQLFFKNFKAYKGFCQNLAMKELTNELRARQHNGITFEFIELLEITTKLVMTVPEEDMDFKSKDVLQLELEFYVG